MQTTPDPTLDRTEKSDQYNLWQIGFSNLAGGGPP